MSTSKKCGRCKKVLPVAEFHKNHTKASGYESHCKGCRRLTRKEYHANNKEKSLQRTAEYRASHKERADSERDAYYALVQSQTQPLASNSGQRWTGPELELVLRQDLSLLHLALMLNRSYQAVHNARHRAKNLPRERFLSGKWTSELA